MNAVLIIGATILAIVLMGALWGALDYWHAKRSWRRAGEEARRKLGRRP